MNRNPANINITMLAVLDAMCRLKSTTRAADDLNLSQPAISQYIKKLTDIAGTTLFVRLPTGLEPTQSAIDFWEYAKRILDVCEEIEGFAEKEFDPHNSKHSFTVAIPLINTSFFLKHITIEALKRFPSIHINLINLPMEQAYSYLEHNEIDLYLGFKSENKPSYLNAKKFMDVELKVICASNHQISNNGAISRDDFIQLPNVKVFTKHHDPIFDLELHKRGLMQNNFIDVPDLESVPSVLQSTPSVFLATKLFAEKCKAAHKDICIMETDFELPTIEIYQMWSVLRSNSSPNIWLRNFVELGTLHI